MLLCLSYFLFFLLYDFQRIQSLTSIGLIFWLVCFQGKLIDQLLRMITVRINGQNFITMFLIRQFLGMDTRVIVGEGGGFPLFIFVLIVIQLILKSYRHRADSLVIFLLMIVFLIQCFVSHSFFDAGFLVFVLVYIINLLESKNNVVHKRSFSVLNVG